MRGPDRTDDGAATVLLLGLLSVLLLVGTTLVSVALVLVARHRADAGADLAALAAASRALQGQAVACRAADAVAAGMGGHVTACRLTGDVAVVTVEVVPPGRLALLGPAATTARAGPG